MSNETDLDWLARNVHMWVPNELLRMKPCDNGNGKFRASWCYSGDGGFTKDQWLTRRAELQNKPSWEDAPDWAVCIVQDRLGNWYFCSDTPNNDGGEWSDEYVRKSLIVNGGVVLGDWRDTLEKRPEQTIADICREVTGENRHEEIFEPFVSVEDAKITIMQGDGDVKRFGGIIGRSLPLEEDAATAKQPAPKGSGNPILGMVLADLTNRALEGKEKYGEPLLAHNGRNPLWDAYQEALDLAMYLRQAIEELG